MKGILNVFVPVWLLSMAVGCTKRMNERLSLPPGTVNSTPGSVSGVRLLDFSHKGNYPLPNNFFGAYPYVDISIGNKKLTNFVQNTSGPTPWFSGNGKFNFLSQFMIPDSLFDARDSGDLRVYNIYPKIASIYGNYGIDPKLDSAALRLDLPLHNDINTPEDVYLYDQYLADAPAVAAYPSYQLAAFRTAKGAFPASDPTKCKIRVINLAAKNVASAFDKMTLCYADGSPVGQAVMAVGYQQASDYVEVPYGTYQFKIKDQSGNFIDQQGGSGIGGDGKIQFTNGLTFNTLQLYKPGGIYTIVLYWNTVYNALALNNDMPVYTVVQDNSPGSNPNYIRMQAVNALPGSQDGYFTVDGKQLGTFLSYGQTSPIGIYSIGPHVLQLWDANGKKLAEKTIPDTEPLDNYTIWGFQRNDTVQLIATTNDMGQLQMGDDNISQGYAPAYPTPLVYGWTVRFLNLSDVPAVNFLDDIGYYNYNINVPGRPNLSDSSAYLFMKTGWYSTDRPTIGVPVASAEVGGIGGSVLPNSCAVIHAYSSTKKTVPGDLLLSIDHPFIANKLPYDPANLPSAEPGVYSLALMGSVKGGSLRFLVVKHNQ